MSINSIRKFPSSLERYTETLYLEQEFYRSHHTYMIKRFFLIVFWLLGWLFFQVSAQLSTIDNTSPSITQSVDQVINTVGITNPIRQGSLLGIKSPDGLNMIDVLNVSQIWGFDQAQNETLWIIRNIINIILSFVSLVVLVLLIFEWYKIVTAWEDTDQYKKALWKLKNYAIAIAGIAVSRFIVSFIFAALWSII